MRPFVRGAKVSPLGCSRPLQRAIVDFAADQPFAQARAKLLEHYGVPIGESTIQRITLGHAAAMFKAGRTGVAYPNGPGASKPIIVETDGVVEAAGRQLLACAVRAGFGTVSVVHAVGDGAPWIVGQLAARFGEQARYLIDFYHVCEYLAAAAAAITPDMTVRSAWIERQKTARTACRSARARSRARTATSPSNA